MDVKFRSPSTLINQVKTIMKITTTLKEVPRTLWFSELAFDNTRLAISGLGYGASTNFDFVSWLLEGGKIKIDKVLLTRSF